MWYTGSGSGGAGGELTPRGTLHLQQLLLEGIANGSVREGADVGRLVCSTFAAQQQVRRPGRSPALFVH